MEDPQRAGLWLGGNLRNATTAGLESVYGIGPKTARFFILHTQKDAQIAVLDTHILKHLREAGFKNIPHSTPTNPNEYARIEKLFLADVWANGKTPADHDLEIWTYYRNRRIAA